MTLTLIVLACGLAAALATYLWSWSRGAGDPDPIDPAAPERAARRILLRQPTFRRFLQARLDRRSAGGFMLTVSFLSLFLVALTLGVLLDSIREHSWLATADSSVAQWGSGHGQSRAVSVLRWVTQLGSTGVVIGILALTSAVDYLRRRNVEVFGFVAAVGGGELILSNLLKQVVRRARPDVLHLVVANGYSFPSGHATAASASWSAVALVLGRDRPRRVQAVLAGVAALVAASVAASRALLGVHWVTDVLGGLALGWGWFTIVAVVYGGHAQLMGHPTHPAAEETRRKAEAG